MANFLGYVPGPGRWSSNVKIGGVETPPHEFILDETLPVLGQDLNLPNRDFVVIPPGRILGARATTLTRLFDTTVLTIANGIDPLDAPSFSAGTFPVGYAEYTFYRSFSGLDASKPLTTLHHTLELPYTATNESYNNSSNGGSRLVVGEWLMPYYGSATSTTATPAHRGKLVRFVEKKVYQTDQGTASGCHQLPSATFPGLKPSIVSTWTNVNTFQTSGASSLHYNPSFGKWVACFGSLVTSVVYNSGASDCQRIAQCIGIQPVGTAGGINATSHELGGWLQWVTDNFGAWDFPPIMKRTPTTTVTNEVVAITAGAGTIANIPIVPFLPITVTVTGTLTNVNTGVQTTLTGEVLSLAEGDFFNDYSQGALYDINWLTGALTFASNLTVTNCTVTYSYEADFKDGLDYDAGILGLTSGRDSGIVGLPAHLDIAGVIGVMQVMILP
jgi:hypothetical protein